MSLTPIVIDDLNKEEAENDISSGFLVANCSYLEGHKYSKTFEYLFIIML